MSSLLLLSPSPEASLLQKLRLRGTPIVCYFRFPLTIARFAWLPLLSLLVSTAAEAQTVSQPTPTRPEPPPSMMLGQMNGHPVFCFPGTPGNENTAPQAGYCVAILPFPDGTNAATNEIQLFVNLQIPQNATRISLPSPVNRPVADSNAPSPPSQRFRPEKPEQRPTDNGTENSTRQELEPLW
ncbi:hypothetical protein [Baaleninema sp.]|uniref:hypothetical protein n=1 Tax=Baaleninema sp. TaxID=3101197 RepID=UPI003D04B1CB